MGHGMKQRDLVRMSKEEIDAFLRERNTATLCTLFPDGSVHAVGMWYGFLDGDIAMESKAKAQKVLNLRRDPRVTVLIETGETYEQLRGVSLIGAGEIVDDPERLFEVGVSMYSRYFAPYTEEAKPAVEALMRKRVAIRVKPRRVISWDHRKLGLPPT
jgi:PPOX class probable F420-dependent enzyme